MEYQKILISFNEASDTKFVTRKWNIVNDQSNANCDIGNETFCKKEVLKSNRCDYNDAYILVRGDIIVVVRFPKCITKIDKTIVDEAEELSLVITMCSMFELF